MHRKHIILVFCSIEYGMQFSLTNSIGNNHVKMSVKILPVLKHWWKSFWRERVAYSGMCVCAILNPMKTLSELFHTFISRVRSKRYLPDFLVFFILKAMKSFLLCEKGRVQKKRQEEQIKSRYLGLFCVVFFLNSVCPQWSFERNLSVAGVVVAG